MEDAVDAVELEVVDGEIETAHVQAACVLLFQRDVVVVGKRVDADHVVARGE